MFEVRGTSDECNSERGNGESEGMSNRDGTVKTLSFRQQTVDVQRDIEHLKVPCERDERLWVGPGGWKCALKRAAFRVIQQEGSAS